MHSRVPRVTALGSHIGIAYLNVCMHVSHVKALHNDIVRGRVLTCLYRSHYDEQGCCICRIH